VLPPLSRRICNEGILAMEELISMHFTITCVAEIAVTTCGQRLWFVW